MPQKLHWRDTNKLFVFRVLYVSSFKETSLGKDDIQKSIWNGSTLKHFLCDLKYFALELTEERKLKKSIAAFIFSFEIRWHGRTIEMSPLFS
jgi:hypothetical protein